MARTVYLNGQYLDEGAAHLSIFDRGFLFADAVYEVTAVLRGRLVDPAAHIARLHRSLGEIRLPCPLDDGELTAMLQRLVEANGIAEGIVYLQISRGPAERSFSFPADAAPTVVAFTQAGSLLDSPQARTGIRVVTLPDLRWQRCDIKSTGLLAASMARQAAIDAGVDDAWMCRDGFVTEGTSNNAYIVDGDGTIVTRRLGNEILAGVTRQAILRLTAEAGIDLREEAFTVAEARSAREAFVTSASTFVLPVVEIDACRIGDGKPGPVARRLRELYLETALEARHR